MYFILCLSITYLLWKTNLGCSFISGLRIPIHIFKKILDPVRFQILLKSNFFCNNRKYNKVLYSQLYWFLNRDFNRNVNFIRSDPDPGCLSRFGSYFSWRSNLDPGQPHPDPQTFFKFYLKMVCTKLEPLFGCPSDWQVAQTSPKTLSSPANICDFYRTYRNASMLLY